MAKVEHLGMKESLPDREDEMGAEQKGAPVTS